MIDLAPIAAAFQRVADLFREDPHRARNTAVSVARLDRGLTCRVREGPWEVVADLSPKAGGGGEGPTPGVLGRAALGSCLGIGFVMEAARCGVPLDHVEVEVEADYDDGAFIGTAPGPAGYSQVRITIRVASTAEPERLNQVAEAARARSPYVDVFSRPQEVSLTLETVKPGGGEGA